MKYLSYRRARLLKALGKRQTAQELFAQSRRIRFSAEPGFVEVGNGYSSALFLRTLAGDSGAVERFKQDLSIDSLDPNLPSLDGASFLRSCRTRREYSVNDAVFGTLPPINERILKPAESLSVNMTMPRV